MVTLILVFLAGFIILDSFEDYYYIIFDNRWHGVDAANRCLILGFINYLSFGFTLKAGSIFFLCLMLYWIFFDLLLNKLRGKPLRYTGNHNWLDKKLGKFGIYFKVIGLVLSGILVYLYQSK